jgi:hypothetical protein
MPKDKPLKNKAADSTPAIPDMKEETYNGSLPWD